MTGKRKRKLAMPDTLIIVASVVLLVAILSWIIPSGTYDYQEMNINGRIRNVAIDGTYHTIDKSEVTTTGFLGFFSVLYRGCVEAADVIFMILCCCGTFGVVVKTGAFHAGIGTILKKLKGKEILLVPIIMMIDLYIQKRKLAKLYASQRTTVRKMYHMLPYEYWQEIAIEK